MWLLIPDSGLLFWMVLVFGIVFAVLARYGFPVILQQVDARKAFIDRSLEAAREAQARLAGIQAEGEAVLARAHEEETRILTESLATRERLLAEARREAQQEGKKWLDEARRQVDREKEQAMNDLRRQVAVLSVDIAGKVLRERLAKGDEQQELVERLLQEWTEQRGEKPVESSPVSPEGSPNESSPVSVENSSPESSPVSPEGSSNESSSVSVENSSNESSPVSVENSSNESSPVSQLKTDSVSGKEGA